MCHPERSERPVLPNIAPGSLKGWRNDLARVALDCSTNRRRCLQSLRFTSRHLEYLRSRLPRRHPGLGPLLLDSVSELFLFCFCEACSPRTASACSARGGLPRSLYVPQLAKLPGEWLLHNSRVDDRHDLENQACPRRVRGRSILRNCTLCRRPPRRKTRITVLKIIRKSGLTSVAMITNVPRGTFRHSLAQPPRINSSQKLFHVEQFRRREI